MQRVAIYIEETAGPAGLMDAFRQANRRSARVVTLVQEHANDQGRRSVLQSLELRRGAGEFDEIAFLTPRRGWVVSGSRRSAGQL